ncbi:MAG: helix-hairpin-helix domain-containing protein [Vicinamibacterales bacterium]
MDNAAQDKVDLNNAAPRALATLPGVGRLLARRIVLDRKLHGAFDTLEDLERIEGVDPTLVRELATYVEVREPGKDPAAGRLSLVTLPVEAPKDDPSAAARVVLAGTPELIRGTVVLQNIGKGPLHTANVRLENVVFPNAAGPRTIRLMLPGSISPGEQRAVAITLPIDPHTPPGTYTAELVVGQERHPATILVSERYSQTIAPSILSILNEPGAKTERRIVVRNEGNVPITLDDFGGVGLEEVDLQCRVIRETVRKTKHPTWDELVGTASDELKKTFAQFDLLRVRVKNKPVRLEPGATAVLTITVQIPKNLPARRRYRGRVRMYDSSLTFELEPRLDAAESEVE